MQETLLHNGRVNIIQYESLFRILRREQYAAVKVIPMRKHEHTVVSHWLYEIGNLKRFMGGCSNLFGFSLSPSAYHKWFMRTHPHEWFFYTLLILNRAYSREEIVRHIGKDLFSELLATGILSFDSYKELYQAHIRIVPYRDFLFITDPWNICKDQTYLSYDSIYFAEQVEALTGKSHYSEALDLCTGVGIIAGVISQCANHVTGSDLNVRALSYARTNSQMNHFDMKCDFVESDLFQKIKARYHFITANPPFVLNHAELHSNGGAMGIEITKNIINELPDRLYKNGRALLLSKAPVIEKKDILFAYLKKNVSMLRFDIDYRVVCDMPVPVGLRDQCEETGIQKFHMVLMCIENKGSGNIAFAKNYCGYARYKF